jgi:hypothetical protein
LFLRFAGAMLAVTLLLIGSTFLWAQQNGTGGSGAANSSDPATAQQTAPANSSASTDQPTPKNKENDPDPRGEPFQQTTAPTSQKQSGGTSNDRLFMALPNFLTLENAGKVPPLTPGQKYRAVARGAFDYVQYPWYGFVAGLSQAENSEPGFGQGAEGYGKRYAAAFADGTIENFMVGAVLPSILHQDPRFFQTSEGTFVHRAGYAVSRIFITRTDSGASQFNYSEIVGSALAAAISTNTYHPRGFVTKHYNPATGMVTYGHQASDRTLPNTASVWGTQVGYDTITIVIKEFWPDVRRKLMPKKEAGQTPHPNP